MVRTSRRGVSAPRPRFGTGSSRASTTGIELTRIWSTTMSETRRTSGGGGRWTRDSIRAEWALPRVFLRRTVHACAAILIGGAMCALIAAGQARAAALKAEQDMLAEAYAQFELDHPNYTRNPEEFWVLRQIKARLQQIQKQIRQGKDPLYGTVAPLGTNAGNTVGVNAIGFGSELIAAGTSDIDAGNSHAIRWTLSGGTQDLGALGGCCGGGSTAYGISGDGSTIVGATQINGFNHSHAFRWTQAGGMQDLGTLVGAQEDTIAYAANQDGSVVVGQADNGNAFRWTQAGGMKDLGNLGVNSVAYAVSADGSVVVGTSTLVGGAQHAFRWTQATGMQDLGALPGLNYATATDISADGNIVVGYALSAGGPFGGPAGWTTGDSGMGTAARPFRWTAATGMQDLNTVLANAGVNMTGTTLWIATSITADGADIGGVGIFPTTPANDMTGYIATVCDAANASACNQLSNPTYTHDFNGDGMSDIAWSDSGGNTALWLMNGSQVASAGSLGAVPGWSIVGQRDFDGDGNADLLWRNSAGDLALWLMNGLAVSSNNSLGNVPPSWTVSGTGDLNREGDGDILWRDGNSGTVAAWLMNGATVSSVINYGVVPPAWSIVGDDTKGDIFWRDTSGNVAAWQVNGAQVVQSASLGLVAPNWTIAGTGDFNGDGATDILWRDTNTGAVAIWFLNNSFAVQSVASFASPGGTWQIAQTGDYNGDGMSDILWKDAGGNTAAWFMNGASVASVASYGSVGSTWQVQAQNAE